MKKQDTLELGLLSVFRLFATFQAALYMVEVLPRLDHVARGLPFNIPLHSERTEQVLSLFHTVLGLPYGFDSADYFLIPGLVQAAILAAYLWIPPVSHRLQELFLPIGLGLTTAGSLLLDAAQFTVMFHATALDSRAILHAWQLVLLLFVPLVLIAWQYNLRAVLLFSGGTALFDLVVKMHAMSRADPYALPVLGIILTRTAIYAMVGYMVVRLIAAQRVQRASLARANAQLAEYAGTLEQLAISRERNRLARELHDTLAHSLSGMAVELEAVKTLWDTDATQARRLLDHSLAATREGLKETRRAMQALRAAPLDDLGLVLAVRHLADTAVTQSGLALLWQEPDRPFAVRLSPDAEQCAYRVAQEALSNIVRHAQARTVTVRWSENQNELVLAITDDGCGFDPDRVDADRHLGLRGMRERAASLGGHLAVTSRPGHGTTVRLNMRGRP